MPIYMTARYHIRPQSLGKCKEAVGKLVEHVKDREPGTKFYLALQEIANPTSFVHFIIFADEAAMILHRNSKAAEEFANALYPETLAPLDFAEYNAIAVKTGGE